MKIRLYLKTIDYEDQKCRQYTIIYLIISSFLLSIFYKTSETAVKCIVHPFVTPCTNMYVSTKKEHAFNVPQKHIYHSITHELNQILSIPLTTCLNNCYLRISLQILLQKANSNPALIYLPSNVFYLHQSPAYLILP